jgi:CubicO group peptidase (beta-lactamase class C family)
MRLQCFPTAAIAAASLLACQSSVPTPRMGIPRVTPDRSGQLEVVFSELVEEHGLHTAGVAVIDQGEVVWTGYYGEQRPGVPASSDTLFNVASITKVVTAETVLRLVDEGKLSLDESMAPHWVDSDVADDPRHELLTPRMVLTHTTGFPNWRFFLEDNTLRFLNDPGTTFGYSGEGFEYLARFTEEKLGRDFGALVRENVLEPIGIDDAAYDIREESFERIARPLTEDGEFLGHYCRPNGWCRKEGTYSAADDMVVSVEDYAAFLISVMDGEGYGAELATERFRVQSHKGDQAVVDCDAVGGEACPFQQGYGLGWEVLDFGEEKLVSHGGSDWAEVALGYFYAGSRDGLVIFLNAPTVRALAAMPAAIEAVDPDSPMADLYRRWSSKASAAPAAESP